MGYSQINSTFKKKLKRNPGEAPIRAYINPKREAHSTPLLTLCAKRLIVTCGASPVLALLALCRYYMCSFFFTCFEKNKKKTKISWIRSRVLLHFLLLHHYCHHHLARRSRRNFNMDDSYWLSVMGR